MYTTTEHKRLTIHRTRVGRHLLEVAVRFGGHLYVQAGIATQTGIDRHGHGIALLINTAHKRNLVGHIPGHYALPDYVQIGGAVIVVAAANHAVFVEELAEFKFQAVANLNGAILAAVPAGFLPVVEVVDPVHHPVATVFGEGIHADVEPAVLRLQVIQTALGDYVHAHCGTAFGDVIHNLNSCRALLPIKGEVVIVSLEMVFLGVAIARAVGNTGDQCITAIKLDHRFQRRGVVIQRHYIAQRCTAGYRTGTGRGDRTAAGA